MYTSDTKQPQIGKTTAVYLAVSAFCIAFDKIYALFGHGVTSAYMSLMFLYPLLGGALLFFLIGRLAPRIASSKRYRLCYNWYNSGIAALTTGSMLQGIFEIAGTASPYTAVFFTCGWTLCAGGAGILLISRRA